jgi:hypothetical protein
MRMSVASVVTRSDNNLYPIRLSSLFASEITIVRVGRFEFAAIDGYALTGQTDLAGDIASQTGCKHCVSTDRCLA